VRSLERALVDEFIELVSIDAESGDEAEIAARVMSKLTEIGLDVEMDDAGSKFGGNAGNVIGRIGEGDPIILCAHLDRVKPGKGIKPVVDDGIVRSSGDTVLAADDISGVVAILAGLREAKKHKPLPAVEVIFTVSEETRLQGSRYLDYTRLRSKMAYIFDASRPVGTVITSSPTHVGFEAHVAGQAAHAAVNPQDGVSAIRAAVFAISKLPFGWVDDHTTTNVGVLSGGAATNIVCDSVKFKGEIRSLVASRASQLANEFTGTIASEAEAHGAKANVMTKVEYSGYAIDPSAPVVVRVVEALRRIGIAATFESTMGGSDGNIFNANGISSVVLGTGCSLVHSTREFILVSELMASARLVESLLTS
jgi:tripeptide aminopeptidase